MIHDLCFMSATVPDSKCLYTRSHQHRHNKAHCAYNSRVLCDAPVWAQSATLEGGGMALRERDPTQVITTTVDPDRKTLNPKPYTLNPKP